MHGHVRVTFALNRQGCLYHFASRIPRHLPGGTRFEEEGAFEEFADQEKA
jgi:hypothetical protein